MEKGDFKPKKGKPRWPGQQQPFIPGTTATPHAPVIYHHPPMMYHHPMVPQSYQQTRPPQGYYPYMRVGPSYVPYNTSANQTPPYYYAPNNQQLSTANLQANNTGARNNTTTLVDPQGCPATPVAPAASLPHPQVHTNIHQVIPSGIRPGPNKRSHSHRVPIIDPITQQEILPDLYSNDDKRLSNDATEKQTPGPETNPDAHSILEEFSRKISEAAKQPTASESAAASNNVLKNVDSSLLSSASQLDAISSNNNNTTNSKTVTFNENKSLGSDVTPELNETLVVSAISDSTVIVPKLPINVKEFQKNSDVQPLVQDINKNVSLSKQYNHNKNKPVVSQVEEVETATENVSATDHQGESMKGVPMPTLPAPATTQSQLTPVSVSASSLTPATAVITGSHPQLQTIEELIDRTKNDDKEKNINKEKDTQQEKETSPALNNSNCPTPVDLDAANGNTDSTEIDIAIEDINKNDQVVPNNTEKGHDKSENETNEDLKTEFNSYENGNDETDKVIIVEDEKVVPIKEETAKEPSPENPEAPPVFVPKYKYSEDQWFPSNPTGKKCYNLELLKQIKDDPLSKHKPDIPLLESCNIMRGASIQEPFSMSSISRPHSAESFLPLFAKTGVRSNNAPRDVRKDARNMINSKGSMTAPSNSPHKPKLIRVSLSLREDIKLNVTENAWKPARHNKENLSEEEKETQELYKQFRGILNKITPQKFDTLMNKVKSLEIKNQKCLEGVIDLVFEKAIDEPNFSKAYAAMCAELSMLKVPADNPTTADQCVNFRGLIINRCQNQFVTDKVDERVLTIEKEIAECTDPLKKKELQLQLEEESRRVRMRSVGNVRFIGELYKLKMLTSKIMVFCMNYLIEKLEEEKLECLCKLLTTIGEQVESEQKEQLDNVFRRMQEIVYRKSNMISSRVRFMIQDVIELRKKRWVTKSVVDSQPKTMDQIQKEAEQRQREIEIMNAPPMGGFRRDDGGRGKRADGRRQNTSSSFMDNTKRPIENSWKSVDTSKLSKGVMQKSFSNIKLAPQMSGWNYGSGAKMATPPTGNSPVISFTKTNKFSVLENVQTDPSLLRGNKDITPIYKKEAPTPRSAVDSRDDVSSGDSSLSGTTGDARPNSSDCSTSGAPRTAPAPVPQEPLPQEKKNGVKSMIDLSLINPDDNEMVGEVTDLFAPQYRAALVTEILNVALEKSPKQIDMIAKSLLHLVSTNTITPDNFVSGLQEIFEFAPDLYIDIPMLYVYLGNFVAPQIEKKHITFAQVLRLSGNVISENHGHLFLKAVINSLKDSMGASFIESKWQESSLQLKDWMKEDQIAKWIEDNNFQFLEGIATACGETNKISTPAETRTKLH